MARDSESLTLDTNVENQDEYLVDWTDEQLEQLLYDTLLVTKIIAKLLMRKCGMRDCVYWLIWLAGLLLPKMLTSLVLFVRESIRRSEPNPIPNPNPSRSEPIIIVFI